VTPARLVWLATAGFAATFGALAVLHHRAFGTGRFDLGNMTQAVWSTAHGHALSVTDVRGEQVSRLGSHFDPILAALTPLWWLWPSPEMLLVVQAVAVALGAVPVFWLARAHLESDRAASAVAAAYLLYPPVQWLTVSDFHPVALACPLLLLAWWFLDQRRLLPFALCAALAVTAKEHVGLTVAAMGVWYAFRYRAPRTGLAVAATAGAIALVAALVIVPHYAAAGSSAFESRYDDPGLDGRDGSYLAALLLPLGLLPLAAPLALIAAVPELALNMLSSTVTQTSVKTHYAATAIPALLAATTYAVERLGDRLAYLAAAAALLGTVILGPAGRIDITAGPHDAAARRALTVVPDIAGVSATNALGAHLSARRRIFSFPILRDATWVAVDTTRLTYLDSLRPGRSVGPLADLARNRAWQRVFEEDGILVFRKRER
jgi:uncharacterized membrane protein